MDLIPTLALERGLPVFPCRRREKIPATAHGFKDATSDPSRIDAWTREIPHCNWGAAMGGDGVFALDIDARSGGYDSLRTLTGINGDLPDTLRATTGGGGEHFLYRIAKPIDKWPARIAPGLDIKGLGGYIIVEPSIHPSGNPYLWQNRAEIAIAPDWLERRLRAVTKRIAEVKPVPVGSTFDGLDASSVASLLDSRVAVKAGQFFVRCVCHRDSDPSLALRDGDNGRVLWHCFGGCGQAELTEAILRRVRECRAI